MKKKLIFCLFIFLGFSFVVSAKKISDKITPVINSSSDEWVIVAHSVIGEVNLNQVNSLIFESQRTGILGDSLQKILSVYPTLNATVLEYLWKHPEQIPEAWQDGRDYYFWGTVYENFAGKKFVRSLFWNGFRFESGYKFLGQQFFCVDPVAIIAC
jgi:hypothetical protein